MTEERKLFEKIKDILKLHLGDNLIIDAEGDAISVEENDIWFAFSDRELTLGFGPGHRHYDTETESITAVETLIEILTNRRKVTTYYKGNLECRIKTEVESNDGTHLVGISYYLSLPFWRKRRSVVTYIDPIINPSMIQNDIEELNKTMHNMRYVQSANCS